MHFVCCMGFGSLQRPLLHHHPLLSNKAYLMAVVKCNKKEEFNIPANCHVVCFLKHFTVFAGFIIFVFFADAWESIFGVLGELLLSPNENMLTFLAFQVYVILSCFVPS